MSLSLPANFENDIQGKDTALVPVVYIGTDVGSSSEYIVISTNQNPVADKTLPILLNIPSLKESIDIEKRNYKISSVNLDISNFPYEGKRFSEIVAEHPTISSSLINVEVRIFWTSPSANGIHFIHDPLDLDSVGDSFLVYFGTIRRYDMTDEKVRLVVEDRSQATLHKDLPLPENYLTGDDVPDKYKNKPIPMVYGQVDRSPCVLSKTPAYDEWGFGEGHIFISADMPNYSDVLDLYTYQDDKYFTIEPILLGQDILAPTDNTATTEYLFGYDAGVAIYTITGSTFNLISKEENDVSSPINQNSIIGKKITPFEEMDVKPMRVPSGALEYAFYSSVKEGRYISGTLVNDDFPNFDWGVANAPSYLGQMDGYPESFDEDIYPGISGLLNTGDTTGKENRSWVAAMINPSFTSGGAENVYIIDYGIKLYFGVMTNHENTSDPINYYLRVGSSSLGSGYPHHHDEILSAETSWGDHVNYWTFKRELVDSGEILIALRLEHEIDEVGWNRYITGAGRIYLETLNTIQYSLFKDIEKLGYYANVKGRLTSGTINPKAPQIIEHILIYELEQTGIDTTGTYDWRYAFTVDKKINSKKLIEGIASASPYIPRFNNIGEFKIDVIPIDGGSVTTNPDGTDSPNHHIKEADCIDFSFSRTKIEDVYTKIVFKYNWDYARGEFNDSVVTEVGEHGEGIIPDYVFDYYGFTLPTETDDDGNGIHPDSTLVIDDDRGKYIRNNTPDVNGDDATAKAFANWYLLWSCNQHLKMKIKLPLKYMNLEIGDFVDFGEINDGVFTGELLGGVKPYGIDYRTGGEVNKQAVFKNFLITSTNKTLEWVEIECIQMHNLDANIVPGCTNISACNYNVDATEDDGSCDYGTTYYQDLDGDGLGNGNVQETFCDNPEHINYEEVPDGWVTNSNDEDDDCLSNVYDCAGECSGSAVVDGCGICTGGNTGYTFNGTMDCAGVCDGDAVLSGCDSLCNSDAINDCAGVCGGDAELDECGVCNGDGAEVICDDGSVVCFEFLCEVDIFTYVILWGVPYDIATTTELDLWDTGLTGEIPPEIGQLVNLTYIDLHENYLTGEIPSEIGNLTNLEYLDLNYQSILGLSGSIPPEIGNLTNLTYLNLTYNQLTGEIPSEIGNLTNLIGLALHNNQLTGEIPSDIGNLTNLTGLGLAYNQFTGSIPSSIGNLTNLTWLNLSYNQLTGLIPYEICDQGDSSPSLRNNQLCPPYPDISNGLCLTEEDLGYQDTSNCDDCGTELGDFNADGGWNVLDIVTLANCVLANNCNELEYACAGDMDGSGGYNVLDIVTLVYCVLNNTCGG